MKKTQAATSSLRRLSSSGGKASVGPAISLPVYRGTAPRATTTANSATTPASAARASSRGVSRAEVQQIITDTLASDQFIAAVALALGNQGVGNASGASAEFSQRVEAEFLTANFTAAVGGALDAKAVRDTLVNIIQQTLAEGKFTAASYQRLGGF